MQETASADRYANALYLAVQDSKKFSWESVHRDLVRVHQTIASDDKLRTDLMNPLLPASQKKSVLRKKAGKEISEIAGRFIDLLVEKKRMNLLSLIVARFEQAVEESQGALKASVKSAFPLAEAEKKEMEKRLSGYFKKKIRMDVAIDPELLGGFVIKAGDTVVDNSIRNKLKNLSNMIGSPYGD